MTEMRVCTIGSSGKSAEEFFGVLGDHGVERVIDVRLSNRSQLAGFTKSTDLPFFLRTILRIDYLHAAELAPTQELLNGYKGGQVPWEDYEVMYRDILTGRQVESVLAPSLFANACLLCSEATADRCHRRLAGEYLQRAWATRAPLTLVHL